MSFRSGKSLAVVLAALLFSSSGLFSFSGAFAADLVASEAPKVSSHRHAPAPTCGHRCKKVRVCDDLTVTYPEKTEVVAVCYKPAY